MAVSKGEGLLSANLKRKINFCFRVAQIGMKPVPSDSQSQVNSGRALSEVQANHGAIGSLSNIDDSLRNFDCCSPARVCRIPAAATRWQKGGSTCNLRSIIKPPVKASQILCAICSSDSIAGHAATGVECALNAPSQETLKRRIAPLSALCSTQLIHEPPHLLHLSNPCCGWF